MRDPRGTKRPPTVQRTLWAILLGTAVLFLVFTWVSPSGTKQYASEPLSRIVSDAKVGKVTHLSIDDGAQDLVATYRDGHKASSEFPLGYGTKLVGEFSSSVSIEVHNSGGASLFRSLLLELVPISLIVVALWFFMRSSRKVVGGLVKRDSSRFPTTTFRDVGGVDEVVEELAEIVDYLHDPQRYEAAGAKVPRGVLLVGPPGTGKTMLAKAVAGEAGVAFFALSGSDFVDTFVGVGAGRVRTLFKDAHKSGKAIVFIDELDAIGRARSGASDAGTAEGDRTLNALLVEMDGFHDSHVIVIGATNRPEVLDSALLRSGRFERTIHVGVPDRLGREQILSLLLGAKSIDPSVDVIGLSRRTSSLSGADLAYLVNESALQAVRNSRTTISMQDIEHALEVTFLGRARTSMLVSEADRRLTAAHEAGHCVVALCDEAAERPVRVSIVPRGNAGGVTWTAGEDRVFVSRSSALAQLRVLMAGRAGEHLEVGDDFTSGASSDLREAGAMARRMVYEWAMSDLGAHWVDTSRQSGDDAGWSAIGQLLREASEGAKAVLAENYTLWEMVRDALLEDDTLDRTRLDQLVAQATWPSVAAASTVRIEEVAGEHTAVQRGNDHDAYE